MGDGDVSAAIWAAREDGPFDMLLGIGAAPEGVITAAAIRGIGGVFEGRLVFRSDEKEKRAETMVSDDLTRLWDATDLCKSDDAFAASGYVTAYLPGVIVGEDSVQTFAELKSMYKPVKLVDTIEHTHCDKMAIQLRIGVRLPEGHWSGDVSRERPEVVFRIEETMPLAAGRGTARIGSSGDVLSELREHNEV